MTNEWLDWMGDVEEVRLCFSGGEEKRKIRETGVYRRRIGMSAAMYIWTNPP